MHCQINLGTNFQVWRFVGHFRQGLSKKRRKRKDTS